MGKSKDELHGIFDDETPEELAKRWTKEYIDTDNELKTKLWGYKKELTDDEADKVAEIIKQNINDAQLKSSFTHIVDLDSEKTKLCRALVEEIVGDFEPPNVETQKEFIEMGDFEQQTNKPTIKYKRKDGTIGYRYKTIRYNNYESKFLQSAVKRGMSPKKMYDSYMKRFKEFQSQEGLSGKKDTAFRWRTKSALKGKYYRMKKK